MSGKRTKFAILAILRIQPMSGYAVREFCKTRLKHFWNESFGQIYPTLKTLKEDGLVRPVVNEKNDSRSIPYEITETGLDALKEWLLKPPAPRIVRDEFLLKLFCGKELPNEDFSRHVAAIRQNTYEQLEIQQVAGEELDLHAKTHADYEYWKLILRYGELAMRARLKWCDEAEQMISQMDDGKKGKRKTRKKRS